MGKKEKRNRPASQDVGVPQKKQKKEHNETKPRKNDQEPAKPRKTEFTKRKPETSASEVENFPRRALKQEDPESDFTQPAGKKKRANDVAGMLMRAGKPAAKVSAEQSIYQAHVEEKRKQKAETVKQEKEMKALAASHKGETQNKLRAIGLSRIETGAVLLGAICEILSGSERAPSHLLRALSLPIEILTSIGIPG